MVQKTIRQYYLLVALVRIGMGLTTAMYATYLIKNGLNLFEVNVVNCAFFTAIFFLEIPTGAFADVFGRKASFVLSCVLYAIGMVIYGYSTSFAGFIVAELVCALGFTFSSGAFTSWFVDTLQHHGYDGPTEPLFARREQIGQASGLAAALAGSVIADYHLALPWLLGAAFFAAAALVATMQMCEDYFERRPVSLKGGWRLLVSTAHSGIGYGIRSSNVRFLMLLGFCLYAATMAPNMQWQPHFGQWLATQSQLGLVWIGMSLFLLAGTQLAPQALARFGSRRALLVCNAIAGAGIMATVMMGGLAPSLAAFYLHELGRGAIKPLHEAYLHQSVVSAQRATITSFESLATHMGGALGLLLSGALAHWGSIPLAWLVSGGGLLLMCVVLWRR